MGFLWDFNLVFMGFSWIWGDFMGFVCDCFLDLMGFYGILMGF